jgi:hypothetical protein
VVGEEAARSFDVVVLAVGFGMEENPFDLPWNSYWRVDPLDQSFLRGVSEPHIVVVGTGDGALIEILRICIQTFDQGAFLDEVLGQTLGDVHLRNAIVEQIEKLALGKYDLEKYRQLRTPSLDKVREVLRLNLRRVTVTWLTQEKPPFSRPSLRINRFLVSQLLCLSDDSREKFIGKPCCEVEVLDVIRGNGYYVVRYRHEGRTIMLECDHAVIRYGPEREALRGQSQRLLKSVAGALADGPDRGSILESIGQHIKDFEGHHHGCYRPQWDTKFKESLPDPEPKKPVLYARFVKRFLNADAGRTVYRIRIWLENVPEHLKATFEIHPEFGKRISRGATGRSQEQWINTWGDYKIRVLTSDRREWDVGSVTDALERGKDTVDAPPVVKGDETDAGESFDSAVQSLRREAACQRRKREESSRFSRNALA